MKTSPPGLQTTTKIAKNGRLGRGSLIRCVQVKPLPAPAEKGRGSGGDERREEGGTKAHKRPGQQLPDKLRGATGQQALYGC